MGPFPPPGLGDKTKAKGGSQHFPLFPPLCPADWVMIKLIFFLLFSPQKMEGEEGRGAKGAFLIPLPALRTAAEASNLLPLE